MTGPERLGSGNGAPGEPALPTPGGTLEVPARFNGPTSSGNGGYTAGLLAERLESRHGGHEGCPVVEVTLRRPPPLGTPMLVEHDGPTGGARLLSGDVLVAQARCTDGELTPVEGVPYDRAVDASSGYAGHRTHPFPRCFACGPDREPGDGLRIFPGPVHEPGPEPGPDLDGVTGSEPGLAPAGAARRHPVAAPWVPHASLAVASDLLDAGVQRVGTAATWAALDCVGGWASDLEGRPMVLGQIAAQVDALPVVGEPHVVVGVELGVEGRKVFTASTLYDSDGRIVARARHTWIAIDPAAFT